MQLRNRNDHITQFHYRTQMKLPEGNVFTSLSKPFCSGVCVCVPAYSGGVHPQGDTPLAFTPPPWADIPLGRHPLQIDTPRWPLKRAVRILLEYILVKIVFTLHCVRII